MNRILISIVVCLATSSAIFAQDSRQRTVQTIVADVLAALPTANASERNVQLADLAAAAPASVVEIAKKMKPVAAGENNDVYEYAISELIGYLEKNNANTDKVREGFSQAIRNTEDKTNKKFLMYWFRFIAKSADANLFKEYVSDSFLDSTAIGALIDIDKTEDIILDLIKEAKADKSLLATAAADKGIKAAEPYLQSWAATSIGEELTAICEALAKIGSESSLNILKDKSEYSYAVLTVALADGKKSKVVARAAKTLMKSSVPAHKAAGAKALMKNNPTVALKTVISALSSEDSQYRNSVMYDATDILSAQTLSPIFIKKFSKSSEATQIDMLQWFGDNNITAAKDIILNSFANNTLAPTAIYAAGEIGDSEIAVALLKQAGENNVNNSNAAYSVLKSLKDDFSSALVAELSSAQNKENLMRLASDMNIKEAAPTLFTLLQKGDTTAANYLVGVVGYDDATTIGELLETAKSNIPALQNALSFAIQTKSADERYSIVSNFIANSKVPENFFPILAKTGTDKAVENLAKIFENSTGTLKSSALDALTKIDNFKAAPVLLAAAKNDTTLISEILPRYIVLTQTYENSIDKKSDAFAQALMLANTQQLKTIVINALSDLPTINAFMLAGNCLDNNEVAYVAAHAVKNIASKIKNKINYADFQEQLEKAQKVFMSSGNKNDIYAVDELAKMLLEVEYFPISELTTEEKKEGFEMLFDGSNLDKWQGDKEGYVAFNGAISVTANYGSSGNLYTLKEYKNFVMRFEFCFLSEGVNNGVGIRTPIGVDASYDAMCEVQILDHDAPIYEGLSDYQVHGSAYGIIPAKRVIHKPFGEWSSEEIRVDGNRIKVTLNGEVILDGDVYEACSGYNIAPDGSDINPYTADNHNHPGLFNEKGYISFCGHGEGLRLRNIRILELNSNN